MNLSLHHTVKLTAYKAVSFFLLIYHSRPTMGSILLLLLTLQHIMWMITAIVVTIKQCVWKVLWNTSQFWLFNPIGFLNLIFYKRLYQVPFRLFYNDSYSHSNMVWFGHVWFVFVIAINFYLINILEQGWLITFFGWNWAKTQNARCGVIQ